ncbi:MAG TPA: DUF222 domain-containing protein, partial [Nakamurella sp.]|nr:DUF222 domain-containing protein [Nakamurella sp.]
MTPGREDPAEALAAESPEPDADRTAAELDAPGLLDAIRGTQRLINWAQALQQRYIAALARPGVALPLGDLVDVAASPLGVAMDVPEATSPAALLVDPMWGPALRDAAVKVAAVEIGCALRVAPITARARTERAVLMADELPGTLAAQQRGDLDGYRASIIAEGTTELNPECRRAVERAVLPTAADRTPSRVREVVDREVARIDPDAAARREQVARQRRGVRVERGQHGMGTVRADVSTPDAEVTFQVLDRIAAAVQAAGLAAGRGRSQIRADVFTDLFKDLAATGWAST